MAMLRKNPGFTLIEMSIVLVIIGLLAGGLIAAQSLIASARLQSVLSDVERYKKATLLFQDKYHYLPGDMPTAQNFWYPDGSARGTADPNGCPGGNIGAPTIATCNGDGNGFIGDNTGSTPASSSLLHWPETYRFWQHLSNAGMIEGSYTGAISSRTGTADPGLNIPVSKIKGAGFTVTYSAPIATGLAGDVFGANYGHVFVFGAPSSTSLPTFKPALSTAEALLIDQKLDDGMPGTGNILSFTSSFAATPHCATTTGETTAAYDQATIGIQCSLIFITGF